MFSWRFLGQTATALPGAPLEPALAQPSLQENIRLKIFVYAGALVAVANAVHQILQVGIIISPWPCPSFALGVSWNVLQLVGLCCKLQHSHPQRNQLHHARAGPADTKDKTLE